MAVSILQRPIGVILDTCVTATVTEDYGSGAVVTKTAHGLNNGDYVYVQSNVENYNGFWPILKNGANQFILLQYPNGPYVPYIVDATITYCKQLSTHGWSCVHLPIVYRLNNNRFPLNSIDTVRTISSFTNDGGYVRLTLSGSLGTFEDLSFIKISNAPNTDYNGVYQILDKLSTSSIVINLATVGVKNSDIVGASIQLYYSNYNIVVRVYGGLDTTHQWTSLKPYTLLATLRFIPDSNNQVKFSINEILKSQIQVKNNLLGPTLPNDITGFTQFYIEYTESYDVSDGYTIQTQTGTYTSDKSTFEGVAVNAKLPFKNIQSGYLSEYLMTNTTAKFLTLFTIPVLFSCSDDTPDCYQDVSFLISDFQATTLRQVYYSNGIQQSTVDVNISDYDKGLYRVPLSEVDCSYDRVDIKVIGTEEFDNPSMDSNLDNWSSESGYTGGLTSSPWTHSIPQGAASNQMDFTDDTPATSNRLSHVYKKIDTSTRTINYTIRWDDSGINVGAIDELIFLVEYYKNGVLVTTQQVDNVGGDPNTDLTGSFVTLTGDFDMIKIRWLVTPVAGSFEAQIIFYVKNFSPVLSTGDISETKTFDIECGCANQEMRLTWLNHLGGYDYWNFTAEKEYQIDILETGETSTNIFPSWPNSYGEFANTIDKQTFRNAKNKVVVRSQHLTLSQLDAIKSIKTSPLVQIINSRQDTRTVIVDSDSFSVYADNDKTYSIQFTIGYTDDIPSQKV